MTRKDSVRHATSTAKDSVRHAAEVVAPYAGTAKDTAVHYAHEARTRIAPRVSQATQQAAEQARHQYGAHLAPRIEQARTHVPARFDEAAQKAAVATKKAAKQAAEYTVPRVEHAVAATQPVREEATARSTAALAALRGQVSAKEVQKLVRKHERRARSGRVAKRLAVLGLLAGGAFAAWKWWDKQANPDWLVEPPAATEVRDRTPLTSVDGSAQADLDPEVQAKQAEAEAADPNDR